MNKNFKAIDLTHTIYEDIPTWDDKDGFRLSVSLDYSDWPAPNSFRANAIQCSAGIGTHLDAPSHMFPAGRTVDQLREDELIANCVVINVSDESDPKYKIMPTTVERFEKVHGVVPKSSFVIFYTGWERFWNTREKYHNNHNFPSVHPLVAEMLVKRGVVGIGIDTMSCDTGQEGFPVHRIILGADKYLVENVAQAAQLPPVGSKIFVLPMKIAHATEAPVRLMALTGVL